MFSPRAFFTVAVGASFSLVLLHCGGDDSGAASNPGTADASSAADGSSGGDGSAILSDAGAVSLLASSTKLDFGSIVLHDASTETVEISSKGAEAFTLDLPVVSGNGFWVDAAAFPANVAAGDHFTLPVTFSPVEAGAASGKVAVSPKGGKEIDVALSGTGIHAVDVTWTASTSSDVAGYNLYRGTTSGGPYPTKLNTVLIAGTSYEDTTVMSCTTYYYVATAVDSMGTESAYSAEIGAAIPCP